MKCWCFSLPHISVISGTFVSNKGVPYYVCLSFTGRQPWFLGDLFCSFLPIFHVVLYFHKVIYMHRHCEHVVSYQDSFLGVGPEFARGPRKPT